jgi:hydrogenase maturation protein HypF
MRDDDQKACLILHYFGHVQGVGMRPFLYQLAAELDLKGIIFNQPRGVTAELEGNKHFLEQFRRRVLDTAAQPIAIRDCKEKCRFFGYPFLTCCECGPRWTILERFPFERSNTTYTDFTLCHECLAEYQNPGSRRHHAQTLSCPGCGPSITFLTAPADQDKANLQGIQAMLMDSGVGLIKGLGGFQLIGNAGSPAAIQRIRLLKQRPAQSLAVMLRDEDVFLRSGGHPSQWQHLRSAAAPILSLREFSHPLAGMLAPDLRELGVMAATTPLHSMLFNQEIDALVVTSGNPKGFPLPGSRADIRFALGSDIDFIIDHGRRITHTVDDSVVRDQIILRKARGLTPAVHKRHSESASPKDQSSRMQRLALGADLKNAIALQLDDELIEFPYCGDLQHPATLESQAASLQGYLELFGCQPDGIGAIAVDFHPETFTRALAPGNHTAVPHHIAHAWVAFSQCPGDLVLTFDSTGYDEDLELGGGDGLVLCDGAWQRALQLQPIKFIGGSSSVAEPWKSLVLYFAAAGIAPETLHRCFPGIEASLIDVFYAHSLASDGPLSSSMGRWFDAAAALIEFGDQTQSYEAQAPIRLEHLAEPCACSVDVTPFVTRTTSHDNALVEINGASLLLALYQLKYTDLVPVEHLAYIAHDLIAQAVALACRYSGVSTVTGAGGVFQNALFTSRLQQHLASCGIVFTFPDQIPLNDQAIALGQLLHLESLHA